MTSIDAAGRRRSPRPRRAPANAIALLPALLLTSAACRPTAREAQAVVLVTLDTTRADRLGCYGNGAIETPALDSVARDGVLFEQASAVAPLTLPSHASMMTGRYPVANGVRNNGMYSVPPSERTLAEVFHEHGFDTAAFVSAFPVSSAFGLNQGFATYDERFDAAGEGTGFFYEERNAASVTAAALPWIAEHRGRKFFLWIHYFDPHARYQPPSPFKERYAPNPYDGEIAFVDSKLAELIDALSKAADPSRTILAVAGDHGESLGQHGEVTHGLFVYEATIRPPLLIRAAGRLPSGLRLTEPVSLVDLFPTLLDLAGLSGEIAKGPPVQGRDLVPTMTAAGAPMRSASTDGTGPAASREIVIESLMPRLEFGWSELLGIRDGRWKYIEAPRPELYDLANDPKEERNLLEGPAIDATAGRLKARLETYLTRLASPGSEETARRPMDEETLEKLRSLGYMQGGAGVGGPAAGPTAGPGGTKGAAGSSQIGAPAGSSAGATAARPAGAAPSDRPGRRDPKDMIGLYEGLDRAALLARKGDIDGAMAAFKGFMAQDPGNAAVEWRYAEALFAAKRFVDLDRFLAPRLDSGPSQGTGGDGGTAAPGRSGGVAGDTAGESANGWYWVPALLAQAREAEGKRDEAIALYRKALERDPDYAKNAIRIATLLREAGKIEESRAEAGKILERRPGFLPALELAADDERDLGDKDEAIGLWRRALSAAPDDPVVLSALGALLFETQKFGQARPVFEHLAAVAPKDPQGPIHLGALDVVQGHYDEALATLRRAAEIAPDDPDLRYWLGTALMKKGDLAGAESQIGPLVASHPESFQAHRALGLVRKEQGRRDEAVASLRRALALKPGDPLTVRSLQELGAGP